jgi:hypothetical protein
MRPFLVSKLDICKLISQSQGYYSMQYWANSIEAFAHDAIKNRLQSDKYTSKMIFEKIDSKIVFSENGLLIFDDTVLPKINTKSMELVNKHYSGSYKGVLRGISLVITVYLNPETNQAWIIDIRIFDKRYDGKTKVDHVKQMLENAVLKKNLKFSTVLMDLWYATHSIMQKIIDLKKSFVCRVKKNRKIAINGNGNYKYTNIEKIFLNDEQKKFGVEAHLFGTPANSIVKLFCINASTSESEYFITNDLSQNSPSVVQNVYSKRWIIEQLIKELKQYTGIGKCQARKQRIQRNYIHCAVLVLNFIREKAYKLGKSVDYIKKSLLKKYMQIEFYNPTFKFT